MSQHTAFPLAWPVQVPRTKSRTESRFLRPTSSTTPGSRNRRHTIADATRMLQDELDRLGATDAILSTNLRLNMSGGPRGYQGQPSDPGVCVYFKLKGKSVVLPSDRWQHVECNIYAIAKHIEALRGQDRWGVGSVEQAFAGYMALEAQTQSKWFEVLGVAEGADVSAVKSARLALIRKYHPDGSEPDPVKFNQIDEAFRVGMQLRGQ